MAEIDRRMVLEAVADKIETLKDIGRRERVSLDAYREAYESARERSPQAVMESVDGTVGGCVPLEDEWEFDFGRSFDTRRDMRDWAGSVLKGEPISGVDGSQAPAGKVLSLPMALVRAVAFLNGHDGGYERLERYRVLTPEDASLESPDYYRLNNLEVNFTRFDLENEVALESLREGTSLVLIDNTFILSYLMTGGISEYFELHLKSLLNLLARTEGKSMVAGVVDPSQSKEISDMLSDVYGIEKDRVNDSALVHGYLGRFDRTCVYRSRRRVLRRYGSELEGREVDYRNEIGFFYLKAHSYRPMRVEFPLWIWREGLVDKLADLIRASCVLGEGYPYELSKAHEHVTISMSDRERFYEIVQGVAEREGIDYSISQKEIKKRRPVR